jgi:uncharacterized membrane protein YdjX (TVP38/TMEM64 family)
LLGVPAAGVPVSGMKTKMEGDETRPADGGWPRWLRRAPGVLLVLALLVLGWRYLDHQAMWEWKRQAHPLAFFAAMAVLPAVGFPTTPFYLLAGATFGTATGLAVTWGAMMLNLVLCYWIARSGLRPVLIRWLARAGARLPDVSEANEVRFALLVKLAPGVPSFAKNYLLGVADVSFRTYFTISLLVTGSYASCFVILGESFLEGDAWRAGVVLFVLLVFGGILASWRRRKG